MLSLFHHRFHRLSARSIRALTAVHNFHLTRSDGTTAAERFFCIQHANMFESLVENVRIPGRPRQQHHDQEKRLKGWEKATIFHSTIHGSLTISDSKSILTNCNIKKLIISNSPKNLITDNFHKKPSFRIAGGSIEEIICEIGQGTIFLENDVKIGSIING